MVTVKSPAELELMRYAGKVTGEALRLVGEAVRPGVTTERLDRIVRDCIIGQGCKPAFLGYNGFPGAVCVSVNEQVIHGLPGDRTLKDGDIVSIDTGAIYKGFYSDAARTFAVGDISAEDRRLIEVTRESFFEVVKRLRSDMRLGDIGATVQGHVESNGYSVVREYVGHGIGGSMHEEPQVPNYGKAGQGLRLKAGMTLAIEPMVNAGGCGVAVCGDGWTVVTADGKKSAHYENTVLVLEDGCEVLSE